MPVKSYSVWSVVLNSNQKRTGTDGGTSDDDIVANIKLGMLIACI